MVQKINQIQNREQKPKTWKLY